MDRNELEKRMTVHLRKCMLNKDDEINLNSHFENDLGMDSMGYIEFIASIEDEFGINFSADEIRIVKTFDNAINLVTNKLTNNCN
jgi:acyl carrier protein